MTYTARPYGGGAYAGGANPASSGGGIIVDPSNPTLPGYSWVTQVGPGPFAGIAYGGGGLVDRPASGGMAITPDPDMGQTRIQAWWTGAPYLRIVRRMPDGTGVPVRGGYPIAVAHLTRRNLCTNPSFETSTSGHLAGANTTLTRTVGTTLDGAAFGRLKATAAGAVNDTIPALVPTDGPFGISFGLMLSAQPSGALTLTVAWQDSAGTTLAPSVATIASGSLAPFVGRWDRIPAQLLQAPYGAVQGALALSIAGMPINGTADLDVILIEPGGVSNGYFDGDYPYAQWNGTAELSTSAQAVPSEVYDREAPLDVPVRYELTAPDQPAFRVLSEEVTLASNGRSWLTHPQLNIPPWRVEPSAAPEEAYGITRDVFQILGQALPIAVSAAARQAQTGTLKVPTENFGERDRLKRMLADGQPILLRAPAEFGRGLGEWLSIDTVTITPPGYGAWEGTRTFTLPYAVCAPPATLDIGLVA